MKSKRTAAAPPPAAGEGQSTLPAWKAFVVQFSRETRARTAIFAGRVEHVSSGRRARFASAQELVAVLRQMLDQLGEKGN